MVTKIKRYNPSEKDLVSSWHVIDARGQVLGRLATKVAMMLMGKHRPEYVPHMISGDFVVVTNAAEIVITGNKVDQVTFQRHTFQRSGHVKQVTLSSIKEKFPERVVEHAVRGMLPRNRLGERMIRMLKVYPGEEHPHAAQVIGSERRPERDAVAATKAAEAAATRKAKAEIAAEAKAKSGAAEAEARPKAAPRRRAASTATKAPATKAPAAKTARATKKDADSGEKKTTARSKSTAAKPAATRRAPARSKKSEE
jgi:large subunit ribosomal protein L13